MRGVDLVTGAAKLAAQMGMSDFKASDGWLWRFRKHYGLHDVKLSGEVASADTEAVEPFRLTLSKNIQHKNFTLSQIYNVEESCIMWRALLRHTQAREGEGRVPGNKISKE